MSAAEFPQAFSLSGQTALVPGGGTGLGLGMARCFVAAGARVILVGRREQKLAKACSILGERALSLPGDITKLEHAAALADARVIAASHGVRVIEEGGAAS